MAHVGRAATEYVVAELLSGRESPLLRSVTSGALRVRLSHVNHRLAAVGGTKTLITSDAMAILHEATHGALRNIDRVTTNALKTAARKKLRPVDHELIERVLDAD